PQITADILSGMRLVERNNTRLVELLVDQRHVSGGLQNLSSIVVARREHGTCQTTRDATDVKIVVLPRRGRTLRSEGSLPGFRRVQSLLTFRRQGRHSPVR